MADKSFIGNLAEKAGDSLRDAGRAAAREVAATVVSAEEQAMGKANLFEWLYGGGKKMSEGEMKQAEASDKTNANEGVKKILQELTSGNQEKPGSPPTESSSAHEAADQVGHDGKNPDQPIQDLPNPEIDPQQASSQNQGKQQSANPFNDNKKVNNATAQQIAAAKQDLFHQAQALGISQEDEEEEKKKKLKEEEEMLKQKKQEEKDKLTAPVGLPAGKKNAPGKMKARQQPLDSMETRKKRE